MTTNGREYSYEEQVMRIREVGESLIKNAESLAGCEKYLTSVDILIRINKDGVPAITVTREFTPEKTVERLGK